MIQVVLITNANAAMRPALTNEEMRALPATDIGRLRWLQQYQSNVLSQKNENLKTTIANVEKWHDCIQLGVDALSLGLDVKAGLGLENIAKTRSRYAEAASYLEKDGWFNKLVGSGFKEMADAKRRQTYMFAFGMALDLLGTKKLSCFGGENTALTATLNATSAQETAEAIKKVMEHPEGSVFKFFVNTLLAMVIDTLKGIEVMPDFLDFVDKANSPQFLKLFKQPFSGLKVAAPKWDFYLTKGLQISNDLFFAELLALKNNEVIGTRTAFEFLDVFYGRYKGNLAQFCLENPYGADCTKGTIESIFYAYLNVPEIRETLLLRQNFFDHFDVPAALATIRTTLLQGPLLLDIKIIRIPDGLVLNDTNLTNGTKKFTLQSSLNPLIALEYTSVGISTDCKLNFGTAALMDCATAIDRPGQVAFTINIDLKKGTQSATSIQIPLNFPVVAAASDMSPPYWAADVTPAIRQSEQGNFTASYTIQAPRFVHNPSGQVYELSSGDDYWAWVQRGDTFVTPDIVPPDLLGQIPLEFQITPEDRAAASKFTAYLASSSRYAEGYLPRAVKQIPLDGATIAALDGATPYLRVIHPDLVAAAYDSADRSFAVKAGDVLQFLPGNDSRFIDFNLFTGNAYIVFICKDSQSNAFCNGTYGSKIQAQLQANGALQITAPAVGRIIVPAVFGAGVLNGQTSDKLVLEYPWAKLEEQTAASPSTNPQLEESIVTVAAGSSHTCAMTAVGGVKCWGGNYFGELGDSSTVERHTPVDVVGLGGGVTAIAAGAAHSCALSTLGGVKCWGANYLGGLGDNSTTNRLTPVDVIGLTSGVLSIAVGHLQTCAITTAGGAKCWGYNYYGGLGDNSTTMRSTPVDVIGLTSGVTAISTGGAHTCALTTAGGVKCWGNNSSGQLGDDTQRMPDGGRSTPGDVTGLTSGVVAISVGGGHDCALTTTGGVKCWGANSAGQLGDNSTTMRLTPVDVIGLTSGVTAISAGGAHTCALTTGGGVKCWGFNYAGGLGDNSTIDRKTPVDVVGLSSGVKAIFAGNHYTCALTVAEVVKCWGFNGTGGLGDNSITDRLTPVDVMGLVSMLPVTLLSETLPDGSYQVGTVSKSWVFKNGATALTGLKAVPVTGKTDTGLGIVAAEVAVGDVAANADFTVSLPIDPIHAGAAVKSSYWKLVDGIGAEVKINNSKTGQFWLKLRTNLAPTFSPLQLDSVSARAGQTVSLPILTRDGDGDALTVTASSGSVSSGLWSGSFASPGVQAVTVMVSDGIESSSKTISVVVRDEAGVARSFNDVSPGSTATVCSPPALLASGAVDTTQPGGTGFDKDYADLQYLYLRGVAMGTADGAGRKFEPCRYATQAEALKLLMEAARAAGGLVFDEPPRPLSNLVVEDAAAGVFVNASWAAPYVLKAEALGIIAAAETFAPQAPATRAWLARAVTRLQALVVPVDALAGAATTYQFPDQASFANVQDYNDALAAAFFGYMGQLTTAFNPADAMVRADVGRVASRMLRAPRADDITLGGTTPATVAGRSLPGVTQGGNLLVKGLVNLVSDRLMSAGDTVKEEWIDPPASHVKATVIKVGQGVVTNGANVLVSSLAATPVSVATATPPAPGTEIRNLLVLLEDVDSGVRAVIRKDYAVLFTDRDGDRVRDDLDLWPDNPLFSLDTNGNGIPDNVDAAFNLAARHGTDLVTINGTQMTIAQALEAGKFQELAAAVGGAGVSVGGVTYQPGGSLAMDFAQGWNLSGNGSDTPIDVASTFNDTSKVTTVWKWLPATNQWAFHTPSLSGQALADYQASKGYAAFTTVTAGEGFWVNAKAPFTAMVSPGYAVTAAQFGPTLVKGWNLVSLGEAPQTPTLFNTALGYDLTTLWAWDNPLGQWYFYAPSLEKSGGLTSYIQGKGYLDFTQKGKMLGWGAGFWVNKP